MSEIKSPNKPFGKEVVDVEDFNDRVIGAYNLGVAELGLEADIGVSRSIVPGSTGTYRDFSYIAPDIPEFIQEKCVGCMECVVQCPDTAILGKVIPKSKMEETLSKAPGEHKGFIGKHFCEANKYFKNPERKGIEGGYFGIFVDPTKCKGCGECVEACGSNDALKMIPKSSDNMKQYKSAWSFYQTLEDTHKQYVSEKALADIMLVENTLLYVGGAASCMGCGEATALRMFLAGTSFVYGPKSMGILAATGCNTVYGSTYPYNPFAVPWSSSLFENVATYAMGVRMRWDGIGWGDKKVWAIGGDGAMLDIGFQALSRMLASGMDINVLVLDTQVYSNTGGQTSTASFMAQDAKMSYHGSSIGGKTEGKKKKVPTATLR